MATAPPPNAPEVQQTADGKPVENVGSAWYEVAVKAPNEAAAGKAPWDRPYRVYPLQTNMLQERLFVKAVGIPWEKVYADLDDYGHVGYAAVWFMGRLVAGEWPHPTWDVISEQWPSMLEFPERVTIDGGIDSPEA